MKEMKKIIVLLVLCVQFGYANDMVWSKTGHRVVGDVAEQYLKAKTKRALQKLLGSDSLAEVANFADEIKSDRSYSKYSAWHYVNLPADKTYAEVEPSAYGDLVTGINQCIEILKDKNTGHSDKVFHLKMLVHLIGDLHQPMHVGRKEDKGGNDFQIQWFNDGSNLHRLWDSGLINFYGMSYTELADTFPPLNREELQKMQSGTLLDWVEESHQIANNLYETVEVGQKLGYEYSYVHWNTAASQLHKGGVRLAKVLNDLFK
jgi:hypothetical protein